MGLCSKTKTSRAPMSLSEKCIPEARGRVTIYVVYSAPIQLVLGALSSSDLIAPCPRNTARLYSEQWWNMRGPRCASHRNRRASHVDTPCTGRRTPCSVMLSCVSA